MEDRRKSDDRRRTDDRKFAFRKKKRRPCVFCADKIGADYKNIEFIRRFMTDRGKIAPRRMTGCCARHQRMIASEIKKARHVALVPYTVE